MINQVRKRRPCHLLNFLLLHICRLVREEWSDLGLYQVHGIHGSWGNVGLLSKHVQVCMVFCTQLSALANIVDSLRCNTGLCHGIIYFLFKNNNKLTLKPYLVHGMKFLKKLFRSYSHGNNFSNRREMIK